MEYDLSFFNKEDLFADEPRRDPRERVNYHFRRTYSLSPLEILIKSEEKDDLRQRGIELQALCQQHFSLKEYGFLVKIVGEEFGEKLRMPLEFRDFATQDFEGYFLTNLGKFKEKLQMMIENTGIYNGDTNRINKNSLNNPYFLASKERIVGIYEDVRNRKGKFPARFFDPYNKRLARILVRHFIDNVLEMPHNKVLVDLNKDTFQKHRLNLLLDICYQGSQTPILNAVSDAYPENGFPDIHKPDYKPDNPVQELLKDLESY